VRVQWASSATFKFLKQTALKTDRTSWNGFYIHINKRVVITFKLQNMSEIFVSVLQKQRKTLQLQETSLFQKEIYGTQITFPYAMSLKNCKFCYIIILFFKIFLSFSHRNLAKFLYSTQALKMLYLFNPALFPPRTQHTVFLMRKCCNGKSSDGAVHTNLRGNILRVLTYIVGKDP
jgi:hypothetical protein